MGRSLAAAAAMGALGAALVVSSVTVRTQGGDAPAAADAPRVGGEAGVAAAVAEARQPGRSPARAEAGTAMVRQIWDTSDLIGGPAAVGQLGDYLLINDHVRAIIRAPGRTISASMFGGHLIDADITRPTGEEGRDLFGQLSTFLNLSNSGNPDPSNSGAMELLPSMGSGRVGVRACGPSDLFDFLDLKAGLALIPPLTLLVPYDFDAVLPLTVCTTYSLGPSDRSIRIDTELTNEGTDTLRLPVGDIIDAGADVEFFAANPNGEVSNDRQGSYTWGGFGESIYTHLGLMGLFGGDVSYGYYVPEVDGVSNALSTTVAGVAVTIIGTTRLPAVLRGAPTELASIRPGGTHSFTRYFIIGEGGLGTVTAEMFRLQGKTTGTLTGTVKDDAGAPVPYVRVTALAASDAARPVTQAYTDGSGVFSLTMPAGNYGLIAAEGFDQFRHGTPALLSPKAVTVSSGATVSTSLVLPRAAKLDITVKDGNDLTGQRTLPARVSLYGTDSTTPTAVLMDISTDPMRGGLVRELFAPGPRTTFRVKPGTYDVVVTRGHEYDQKRVLGQVFTAGGTVSLNVSLTRVVDTAGYVSADVHVHGINSPDAPIGLEDRVMSFAADGVDMLVSTDHDFVTDYRPVIEEMGMEGYVTSLVGEELTTFSVGHFNGFPLTLDEASRTGGAIDWGDNANLPIDPSTGRMVDVGQDTSQPANRDNLTPPQILMAFEKAHVGRQVRQINHPRGDLGGNFTQIGLDLSAMGTGDETLADPTIFRMKDNSDLFDPTTFDALEMINGSSLPRATTMLNDQFALLNFGYPKLGTAVSDTHKKVADLSGGGRTWVAMSEDDPADLNLDSDLADAFSAGFLSGNVTYGNGPFVTVTAVKTGTTSPRASMGGMVKATDGKVTLEIKIQNPEWITYTNVAVFTNTSSFGNFETEAFADPSELGPAAQLVKGRDFTTSFVTVSSSASGGARREEARLSVPLTVSRDAWVVVAVWGGEAKLADLDRWTAFAFTNPLYIDQNGDGSFVAPCAPGIYNPSSGCSVVLPPTTSWGERSIDPADHHVEDFFKLYELVQSSL